MRKGSSTVKVILVVSFSRTTWEIDKRLKVVFIVHIHIIQI